MSCHSIIITILFMHVLEHVVYNIVILCHLKKHVCYSIYVVYIYDDMLVITLCNMSVIAKHVGYMYSYVTDMFALLTDVVVLVLGESLAVYC